MLAEVKTSIQFCGGYSQIWVLQAPPAPRWRHIGGQFVEMLEFNELPRLSDAIRSYMEDLAENERIEIEQWGREMCGYEQEGDK